MLTVAEHVRQPDGSVRLTIRVTGPLADPWDEVLVDTGGTVTADGDDALVTWEWPSTIVPSDPLALCGSLLVRVLTAWAAAFAAATPDGPSGLILTEPGTVL